MDDSPETAGSSGSEAAAGSGGVTGPSGVAGASTNGGANANGGSSTNGGDAGEAEAGSAAQPQLEAIPSELRRLTASEYAATVTDVLGATSQPQGYDVTATVDDFDNNAAANHVNERIYASFLDAAESEADAVFASDLLRPKIVTCSQVDDGACVRQVITQTGLRLFRRPLLEAEIAGYQKAYVRARTRNQTHEGALKEVLTALLASSQFLYRMEFVPAAPGTQPIGPYDLATRLSYLLWSSAPDDQLLDAAKRGALATDAELEATLDRLLADPRSKRLSQNFAGQWLGARRVPTIPISPALFPLWDVETALAASNEIEAYFDEFLHTDADWLGFFDSRAHFVNAKLGKVYGLSVTGSATQRVELTGVDRRGFLGLSGFLMQTSYDTRSWPTRRGNWIVQRLLCSPLPAPPSDMPSLSVDEASTRTYLEGVNAQPACADCHEQIDPLGLALESYDAIGHYRTAYPNGAAIDPSVTLATSIALPGESKASGVAGVSAALAQSPAFTLCTAHKLYSYGFGRTVTGGERANVQSLTEQWRSGPLTMRDLILRLIQSSTFRSRSDGGNL